MRLYHYSIVSFDCTGSNFILHVFIMISIHHIYELSEQVDV